jgi:hypothetical protein
MRSVPSLSRSHGRRGLVQRCLGAEKALLLLDSYTCLVAFSCFCNTLLFDSRPTHSYAHTQTHAIIIFFFFWYSGCGGFEGPFFAFFFVVDGVLLLRLIYLLFFSPSFLFWTPPPLRKSQPADYMSLSSVCTSIASSRCFFFLFHPPLMNRQAFCWFFFSFPRL